MLKKTACIHQPDFVPYLGFFQRLLMADVFVILDDVQFIRRGWQHRDYIKGKNGRRWLTLSLQKGDFHQRINQVMLSNDKSWRNSHLNLLKDSYKRSKCFETIYTIIESIYLHPYDSLLDFNIAFLELGFKYFDIEILISYSSQYEVNYCGSLRILELVKRVQCETYLTGVGSRDYLDEHMFEENNISVQWQRFKHPKYPQVSGKFVPMLSFLDVLFNCGKNSAKVIRTTMGG
ncbi:MAG: WbqC family protein [Gammaproteobacteria bacterium]|nr:WbqC family protein [Gammaproteobacteria bacterium]